MTDTERTAARLRAALTAAADVMVVPEAPERQHPEQLKRAKQRPARNWARLAPIAAAAGVVVIAAGTVIGAHLASPTGTGGANTAVGTTPTTAQPPRPEFYLTVTYPASGQNVLQFQVRRTSGGAVTGSRTISAANVGLGRLSHRRRGRPHLLLRPVPVQQQQDRRPADHVRPDHHHQLGPDQRLRARRPGPY